MLNIDLLIQYQQLEQKVSPRLWTLAHFNVGESATLPPRGPKGDPINELRVNIFTVKVLKELYRLIDEERG